MQSILRKCALFAITTLSLIVLAILAHDVWTLRKRELAKHTLESKFKVTFDKLVAPLGSVVHRRAISTLGDMIIRHSDTGYFGVDVDFSNAHSESDLLQLIEDLSNFTELDSLMIRGLESLDKSHIAKLSKLEMITRIRITDSHSLQPSCLSGMSSIWSDLNTLILGDINQDIDSSDIPNNWLALSEVVALRNMQIRDTELRILVSSKNLRCLLVKNCHLYSEFNFDDLDVVESLTIFECIDSDDLLRDSVLSHAINLWDIDIRGGRLSKNSLSRFGFFSNLQFFSCEECEFEIEPWEILSNLSALKNLRLANCKISGEGILLLSRLSNLDELDFSGTLFSKSGNVELSELSNYSSLQPPANFYD